MEGKNFLKKLIVSFCVGIFFGLPALAATPDDPLVPNQWYLQKIQAPEAWNAATGSSDVIVAVLDAGVDVAHPDLAQNIWVNQSEIAGNGIDDDGNGYADDVNGWDFIDNDATLLPTNTGGYLSSAFAHGTVVAGLIGGVGNNGIGIAGINWRVKIMPVRILDGFGVGDTDIAIKGVEYAIRNGAKVINMSFTGEDLIESFRAVIQRAVDAGITVVAAVGNANGNTDGVPVYPACLRRADGSKLVIGVAATNMDDTKATFSNYGSGCVDIAAPGVDMFSTMYARNGLLSYASGWSGTSLSAPLVSGAVALIKSRHFFLTPSQILTILQLSVDPLAKSSGEAGVGRLNIRKALEIAPLFAVVSPQSPQPVAAPMPDPNDFIVKDVPKGSAPIIKILSKKGETLASFDAYAKAFRGGVRVAVGDVNGDGENEIVTAPGPGGGPHIRIFDRNGKVLSQFFAFEKSSRVGWRVNLDGKNNDGFALISVIEDKKKAPRTRRFDALGHLEVSAGN